MEPRQKKALWIGVPLLVVLVVIASTYKIWWQRLSNKVSSGPAQPLLPGGSQQDEQLASHVLFLPQTDNLAINSINPATKQIFFTSAGADYLADGSNGKIYQSLSAENHPDLSLSTAVFLDNNYFIAGDQLIRRLDVQGKVLQTYTTKNGLVNGFNLRLHADPFAPNTLWVETFDGLSRLDTVTNKFTNFRAELGTAGSNFSIRSVHLTPSSVWVEVTASSGSKGGLARLDRASQKWQTWGPESFGLTERVDFDAVYTSEQHDLALINKNLYSLNRQTNVWGLLGVLPDTVYGKLYVADDFAYVISSEAQHLLAADLKGKTLKWQTIPATISNGAGLISDTQLGLWLKTSGTAVTRLVNGTLGESLQLPVIENIGAFAGASGNGVYYHTATGFGRYDLTTGKKNAWVTDPTGQLHSASNRVVTEVNGFVYIAEVDLGGYGGSGEENLYRLDLNDDKGVRQYLFAQSLTDLANPLGVDANGTIYMRQGDKPNAGTVVFDWDKLKFVPSKTAWQPESLALLYDDPASYIDYTPLEVSHKGVKLSVTQPAQGSNILTLTATRSGQPAVTAQVTLKPLLTGAFGYAESVNVYNIRFDDTQADIVWIATDKGLIKFNTASGVNSAYWPGHGGSLTKITHLQPLKDSLILGNDSGAYLYSKKQFQ